MVDQKQKEILSLFFDQILLEAAKGKINIYDCMLNIGFKTMIYKDNQVKLIRSEIKTLPTMEIKDYNKFCNALLAYYEEVEKQAILWTMMPKDIQQENHMKYFLAKVWVNMAIDDFKNPASYLQRIVSFMKDETFNNFLNPVNIGIVKSLLNSNIEITKILQKETCESPYKIQFCFTKEYDDQKFLRYYLPDVRYAVKTDIDNHKTGYIYAIQHERGRRSEYDVNYHQANNEYNKKIKRLLNKIKKDVLNSETDEYLNYLANYKNNEENYYPENISDVTQSAVFSLSIMLLLMESEGIKQVIVPVYLIIRDKSREDYYSSVVAAIRKADNDIFSLDAAEYEAQSYFEIKKIRENTIDKFIRTFRRVAYHFDNINIISFPGEFTENLELTLNKDKHNINNEIFQELDNIISNYKIPEKKLHL